MLRWSGSDMVLSGHDLMGRVAEAFMRTANCPGEGPLGFELDGHLAQFGRRSSAVLAKPEERLDCDVHLRCWRTGGIYHLRIIFDLIMAIRRKLSTSKMEDGSQLKSERENQIGQGLVSPNSCQLPDIYPRSL